MRLVLIYYKLTRLEMYILKLFLGSACLFWIVLGCGIYLFDFNPTEFFEGTYTGRDEDLELYTIAIFAGFAFYFEGFVLLDQGKDFGFSVCLGKAFLFIDFQQPEDDVLADTVLYGDFFGYDGGAVVIFGGEVLAPKGGCD